MNNAAALYFKDEFGQSTESAAAIASIFGWMNLFARGLGGFFSDKMNARMGMRGRIIVQTVLLILEGALVLVFANTSSLGGAIAVMIAFSLFVQAAEGSTYGIVPYVDPPSTGSIAGIVGAGGSTGAVGFGLGFRQLSYESAFVIMGGTIMGSAVLSIFINLKGHRSLFWGKEGVLDTKGVLVFQTRIARLRERSTPKYFFILHKQQYTDALLGKFLVIYGTVGHQSTLS
jgi:NNP family nitrate/nitrite transporter-like MFS transporter